MKQRIIALCLLLALLLTGCGGDAPRHEAPATPAPTPFRPTATEKPRPAPTVTPEEAEKSLPYEAYTEVLTDNEVCCLAITGLTLDSEGNWIVHLRMENRSDEIMHFSFLYQSINGIALAEELCFRVAVGGTRNEGFRILRDELKLWGFEKPLQWSFTLQITSAETPNREVLYREELSAAPFGEENAVRIEYTPGENDLVIMDNAYAVVYLCSAQLEDGTLFLDYVAVGRCNRPLLLTLPGGILELDGRRFEAELLDGFGAYATLIGTIPVEGWRGKKLPQTLEMSLELLDPFTKGDPLLKGSETEVRVEIPTES